MEELKEYIKRHKENKEKSSDFATYLYQLMDKYGYDKNSDLYNRANISKQSWSLIISGKVVPSPKTVIKIVFALHASNKECKYLLKKAGYTLSSSSDYALIIRYCLENEIYDLSVVDDYLIEYGYEDRLID